MAIFFVHTARFSCRTPEHFCLRLHPYSKFLHYVKSAVHTHMEALTAPVSGAATRLPTVAPSDYA